MKRIDILLGWMNTVYIVLFVIFTVIIMASTVLGQEFTELYDNPYGMNNIEITKHKVTINTEIIEYSDGKGQATIYGGPMFADGLGTKIKDARSLKDCEFCDNLKLHVQTDPSFNITIEDYNFTDYKNICYAANDTGDIPLRIYLRTNSSEKILDYRIKITKQEVNKWKCYNITVPNSILDYDIEWGWNSTIITLPQYSNNYMGDTYIRNNSASSNYGTSSLLYMENTVGTRYHTFWKFNISMIPANAIITESYFTILCNGNLLDSSSEKFNITAHNSYYDLQENSLTWATTDFSKNGYNYTFCSSKIVDGTDTPAANEPFYMNVTNCIQEAVSLNGQNFTLFLNTSGFSGVVAGDYMIWYGSNITYTNTTRYPKLNFSYEVLADGTPPYFSTVPYNSTTTNQSAIISWTPSESANYTLRYTTSADYTGGTIISNASSLTGARTQGISSLTNYSYYFINVSIWDTSGNYNQSNFTFRTAQNPPPGVCDCVFPNNPAVDKTIDMACLCNITTAASCRNLNFSGVGFLNVSAQLNVSNLTRPITNQRIYITSTGHLLVKS